MKLTELRIRGVVPFKKATLDLDYEGITVIHGLNKDAGPKTTNAAGKSALVGSIAELILDESPSGKDEKIKKPKGKKAIGVKKVEITLCGTKGGHSYEVTKTMGKAKSYEILKDGKTTNIRKIDYTQKRIQALFGLPESQFYSRFYIDSTISHPLIVGHGRTGRQDFLVELFELNDIDTIRKLLNAELGVLTKKGVELRTLTSNLAELQEDLLPKDQRATIKSRLEELTATQAKLGHQLQASQAVSELLAFERSHKPLILELKTHTTLDELPVVYKSTRRLVEQLKDKREAAADWRTYDRLVRLYDKARAPAQAALDKAELSEEDVKSGLDDHRETQAELRQLERTVRDPGDKPKKVEKPEHARDLVLVKLGNLKEELKHSKGLKGGKCPTCGQSVESRPQAKVEADIEKWTRRLVQVDSYGRYTEAKTQWQAEASAFEKFDEKRTKLQKRLKRGERLIKIAELLEDVPQKPRKPQSERPTGFDEQKLELAQAKLTVLQQGRDMLETLQACAKLTDKERKVADKAASYLSELTTINAEVSKLTGQWSQQREILRRAKALKERIDVLAEECKDEKLIRALVSAHSTSGLKKFMVERYSKMLEAQINKYRKIFFPEDYLFEFRYDTKLSLLVHRRYGKRVNVSDVRKLSGAEKRLFTLLLVVATTTLLPVAKRSNVLILDEPEANMGSVFVEQLIRSLPLLQKLVPHIIYVTPQSKLEIPNARIFTVVKHHGIAELIKSEPKHKEKT